MYVFLSTLKSLEIGFLHFYCVLSNTQEYLLECIHKMSTQYLLEYFSSYQYSVLTRLLILSTRSMPAVYTEANIVSFSGPYKPSTIQCNECIQRLT